MFDLDLEDQQVMDQTLRAALPHWSLRECQCFILQMLGYTQEQTAGVLGIAQQNVSTYLCRALEKVKKSISSCV